MNKTTRRLLDYALRSKKKLFKGIFLLLIMTGLQVLSPIIIGKIIDERLIAGSNYIEPKSVLYLILGYLSVGLLSGLFRYISNMAFMETSNEIAINMREDLFSHILKLPQSFFDNIAVGKIVSRVSNDTNSVKELYQTILGQMVVSAVYLIVSFFLLLFMNRFAVLFLLVPLPLVIGIIYLYDNYSREFNRSYRKTLSQINSDINENIRGIEIIKTTNTEEEFLEDFQKINQANYESGIKIEWLDAFASFNVTQTLNHINTLVILLLFGYMNFHGRAGFTVGLMYLLLEYTQRVYSAMQMILQRLRNIERSHTAAEHIFEIMDKEPEKDAHITSYEEVELNGNVEFKNIWFYYKDENYVLKDISFKVDAGETLAIVGQTGSGKSSIINLLFRFYREQKGEILFDGINADDITLSNLRSNMSIVLQETYIYETSLRENITLGEDYSDEEIINALIFVGGENLFNSLDRNLDYKFREGGSNLSHGEKQIITFARAIIRDPKILVLDEATSSVDSETERIIQTGLDRLKKGRTTFIIAHRLSTIKDADKIIVLKNGEIVERGTHNSLVLDRGIYFEMLKKENA